MIIEQYNALVKAGDIERDPAQMILVEAYDKLIEELETHQLSSKKSALGWLFGKKTKANQPVLGLYVYGEVGRGKTMLMDMFFQAVPVTSKRRAHFNDFMADVQDRISAHRRALNEGTTKQNDPIIAVADDLAKQAWLLCFDEFTVTDIADAMILSRLFAALFERGVVLVATSNVAPDNLYLNGLNRGLFLPFIDILKKHVKVLNLDARTDYRLEKIDRKPVYATPLGKRANEQLDAAWEKLVDGREIVSEELDVRGHKVFIPRAVDNGARFEYQDLCAKPYAASDYMAVVKRYNTIFIDNVPLLDDTRRNEAKRFILLIDTLYDQHTRLFISAAETPEKLYIGTMHNTEKFEFDRTASRLFEMQSEDYLQLWEQQQASK